MIQSALKTEGWSLMNWWPVLHLRPHLQKVSGVYHSTSTLFGCSKLLQCKQEGHALFCQHRASTGFSDVCLENPNRTHLRWQPMLHCLLFYALSKQLPTEFAWVPAHCCKHADDYLASDVALKTYPFILTAVLLLNFWESVSQASSAD